MVIAGEIFFRTGGFPAVAGIAGALNNVGLRQRLTLRFAIDGNFAGGSPSKIMLIGISKLK
jgi:hypothetical protein